MTTKDLKALKDFMLWLRRERIAYSTLSAGGVTIDGVSDLKMVAQPKPGEVEARPSMYEKYGAELLKQPSAKPSEQVPEEALID